MYIKPRFFPITFWKLSDILCAFVECLDLGNSCSTSFLGCVSGFTEFCVHWFAHVPICMGADEVCGCGKSPKSIFFFFLLYNLRRIHWLLGYYSQAPWHTPKRSAFWKAKHFLKGICSNGGSASPSQTGGTRSWNPKIVPFLFPQLRMRSVNSQGINSLLIQSVNILRPEPYNSDTFELWFLKTFKRPACNLLAQSAPQTKIKIKNKEKKV